MSSSILTISPKVFPREKETPPSIIENENENCPICMDAIGNTNCAKTSCGHSFCLSCIIECLNTNHVCPLCRKDVVEKKERSAGKKLKMDNAVQIIEDEMEVFGLHQQIAMARQFGIRAIKTVVQSFALSTAHSIAIMQDENEVDGSWEEIEDEEDDASEADSDAGAADSDSDLESDGEVEEDASDTDNEENELDSDEENAADTNTSAADTSAADTSAADTSAADTSAADTSAADTSAADTSAANEELTAINIQELDGRRRRRGEFEEDEEDDFIIACRLITDPGFIDPSFIDPSFIGPSIIGPSFIGPSFIGPSFIGPSFIGPSEIRQDSPSTAGPNTPPPSTPPPSIFSRLGNLRDED
jgi:hypothetical protein